MPYQNLIFEKKDHIGTITFNRPRVLNALNRETMDELDALLSEARSDTDLRVLILTGAGDKAFVAGADINELARQTPASGRETSLHGQAVLHKLETLGKPSIAAINGFALGGGCEMALACSIRLASRTAKLGQPEVKLGIIPGYGGTQRLARLCGKGVAHELCLSGEMISAEEAQRIGLVNHVYEPAELAAGGARPGRENRRECAAGGAAHHGSDRARPGHAAGARPLSGSGAFWRVLRDRGYARRHAGVSRKARGAVSRKMSAMRDGTIAESAMSDDFQANEIRGAYDASGMRFGIVVSRFNSFITERLLAGAIEALEKGGASAAQHRHRARAGLVRDSAGGQKDGAGAALRCDHRHRLRAARGDGAFRLRGLGSRARRSVGANGHGSADYFLRLDLRYARAGHRPRRAEERKQRLRVGPGRARNGAGVQTVAGGGRADCSRAHARSAAKMPQRRKARQYALQMLFQWEIGKQDPGRIEDGFWRIARAEKSTRAFANDLFEAVVKNAPELDALVAHTRRELAHGPAGGDRPGHPAAGRAGVALG